VEHNGVAPSLNAVGTPVVLKLALAYDAVLAILDWLPAETVADAALVAALLAIPEADPARPLDGLEGARCVATAIIESLRGQHPTRAASATRAIVTAMWLLDH
jgi:hypothetical protein